MIAHLILYVVVANGTLVCPNNERVATRQEITVSGGIPQEQLRLEKECDRLIDQAKALIKDGDASKALAFLDNAWDLSQKHSFLVSRQASIAAERGHAHLGKGDYRQASLAFKTRLDLEKRSCDKRNDASPYAEGCGEALLELGSTEAVLGENTSAVAHLRESASCYGIWMDKGGGSSPLVKLGYRVHFGEATVMAGVVTVRLGDKSGGRSLINSAIENLEKARTDPIANPQVIDAAVRALAFAKEQLSNIK
jgi:tetratricopeptide (TPR) repeat protein